MRVLFSADWHLGYEFGGANRIDRLPDQKRQIELIARYVEERKVDVLAVCGDVFEAQERGRARYAVSVMMEALREALARGLQVVIIAGNHDRDYFMETANLWIDAMSPGTGGGIVLRTRPEVVTLSAGGESVNFVLMPFPTATRYGVDLDPTRGLAIRNQEMARHYVEKLEALRKETAAQKLPAVLLTHITVEGTEVGPHRLAPRDDIVVPRSAFPEFELTAVGHIHKYEKLGSSHFYYVGALDRMDIGERAYETRVLLADIGPKGVRSVESLPLDPTPFAEVVAASEDELQAAHDMMERPQETLVRLKLSAPYGSYTAPLIDRARQLFPRIYGNVEHEWLDKPEVAPSVPGLDHRDVRGTIERYFEDQVKDAAERAELLKLVDELRLAKAEVEL